LTADPSAPDRLPDDLQAEYRRHPKLIKLSDRNKALTAKLRSKGYRPISTAEGTPLYQKKIRAQARLDRFRVRLYNQMLGKARKRHFRKADTTALDVQFCPPITATSTTTDTATKHIQYALPERAEVVHWTCNATQALKSHERFKGRIRAIEARAALCRRQETRRYRPRLTVKQQRADSSTDELDSGVVDLFPIECRPKQCIFCLGDDRKPYLERTYEYTRANKMMNEVEKHLRRFGPGDKVACPHPQCKAAGLILPGVQDFKNHTARIHKIFCRV